MTPTYYSPSTSVDAYQRVRRPQLPMLRRDQLGEYGGEPGPQSDLNWRRALGLGDTWESEFSGEGDYRGGLEEFYRGVGDRAYGDLYQNPGYWADERMGVLQEEMLRGGMASPQDWQGNYLSGDEWSAAAGDPWARGASWDPGQLETLDREGAQRQREQLGQGSQGFFDAENQFAGTTRGAIDASRRAALGALDAGDAEARAAMLAGAGNVRGAYGQLRADVAPDIEGMRDAAGRMEGRAGMVSRDAADLRGMVDPSRLEMSDQEVFGLEDQAGRVVQLRNQSMLDRIRRQALASGSANPMALAELERESEKQAAVQAANAVTDAGIAARGAQRDSRLAALDRRMRAAEGAGGLEATSAGIYQGAGGLRAGAGNLGFNVGRVGTDLESGLTGMAVGLLDSQGARRAGLEADYGNLATGAELEMGGRAGQGRLALTGMGTGMEAGIADAGANTGRFIQGTGIDVARDRDDVMAGRAYQLATNRQGVNANNIAGRFDQGYAGSGALSGRYGQVGDARRQDQAETRGYWAGQGAQQGDWAQQAQNRRVQAGLGAGQLAQGATQNRTSLEIGRRSTPGVWSSAARSLLTGQTGRNLAGAYRP